jgi:hypothetical protein
VCGSRVISSTFDVDWRLAQVGDQLQGLLKDMESEVNRVSMQFSPGE